MKPDRLNAFKSGIDYREMHPTREGKRRWRYTLLRGVRLHVRGLSDQTVCYHAANGKIWARHDQFGLYIEAGYSWNGCSPKRWIRPFGWMGTPDFHSTLFASLCHDVHYQFALTEHCPLHKSDADLLFCHTIVMSGDPEIARLYYAAVKRFGKWTDRESKGEYSTLF